MWTLECFFDLCSPLIPLIAFCLYTYIFFYSIDLPERERNAPAFAIGLLAGLSFRTQVNLSWPTGLASLWGLGVAIHATHCISILCIERVQLDITCWRCRKRCLQAWKAKYVLWQGPQNPSSRLMVSHDHKTPISTTRLSFTCVRGSALIFYYLVHTYCVPALLFPGPFDPIAINAFAAPSQPLIRRLLRLTKDLNNPVTLDALALRAGVTFYWLWLTTTLLITANVTLSLIFVSILRLDEPDDWPAFFGNPSEAYTMRRFWGKFWHRGAVRPLASVSRAIASRLLGSKLSRRYDGQVCAFGIFAISGIYHSACSWVLGDRCGWKDELWFFLMNFLVCATERLLLCYGKLASQKLGLAWTPSTVVRRTLGYVWVVCFLCWLVPKWQYPKVNCAIIDDLLSQTR